MAHVREDFQINKGLNKNELHKVIFSIKQQNLDKLEEIFWDVSNPASANYGTYLSRDEVRFYI